MKFSPLVYLLFLMLYQPCIAQKYVEDLPEWLRSDEIVKIRNDTTYYVFGSVKEIGTFHEKKYDDKYNRLVSVGTHKKYFRNSQVKMVTEFDGYGVFLRRKRYFRNGNLKWESKSDTTSNLSVRKFMFEKYKVEFEIIDLRYFRRDGTIRKETTWKNYMNYGEWKYYDRYGNIRKTKEY
jgi:antitoxin component YwqK of YwqJK toxin-antitoxin module